MSWTTNKDVMVLREVAAEGVYYHKFGSRERGTTWQTVATNLNSYPEFEQDVTTRSVRDRFGILAKNTKPKIRRRRGKVVGLERNQRRVRYC